MADSHESDRKTLDEIRSELAAAYPVASEAEEAPTTAVDEEATALERGRPVERPRERRRRYVLAAVFVGITAPLLLVAGHALTREPAQLNASAMTAPSASTVRDPQPAAATLSPAALVELDRQLKALSSDVKALTDRLARSDSRIGGIESQVQSVESSMRRLVDDTAAATAGRAAERTVSAPRRMTTTPARAVAVASNPPLPAAASERWVPAKLAVPENSPPPTGIGPAEEMLVPAEMSRPPATARDGAGTAGSEVSPTLRQKLSAEWRTIKESFAGAGDNFKAAMRDFGRKSTRE